MTVTSIGATDTRITIGVRPLIFAVRPICESAAHGATLTVRAEPTIQRRSHARRRTGPNPTGFVACLVKTARRGVIGPLSRR